MNYYRPFTRFPYIAFIAFGIIIIVAVLAVRYNKDIPCEWYTNSPASDVPAHCLPGWDK